MPKPRSRSKQQSWTDLSDLEKLPAAAPEAQPDTDRNAAAEVRVLATVPAAWPSGISQLAQAVDACQRRDSGDAGTDWLQRAPNSIALPTAYFRD